MAILDVLEYPDPRLRTVAAPVKTFDGKLKTLVEDMFETMYEAGGIGLAATQVNVHKRVLVMDISDNRKEGQEGEGGEEQEGQQEKGREEQQGKKQEDWREEQREEQQEGRRIFINPEFEVTDPELFEYEEGCLSVPGFFDAVSRPKGIAVKAQDVTGKTFELNAEGLLAICIQHEIDHLNGKLFVDYLSNLKRQRIRDKLEKEHRKSA
ncbi:MAG: peptide deformylase [Pseudohongiellaceae bacterium]